MLCSFSVARVNDFLMASAFPVFLRASRSLITQVSRTVFSQQSCRVVSRTPVPHPSGNSLGWNAGVWLSFRTASGAFSSMCHFSLWTRPPHQQPSLSLTVATGQNGAKLTRPREAEAAADSILLSRPPRGTRGLRVSSSRTGRKHTWVRSRTRTTLPGTGGSHSGMTGAASSQL